MALTGTDRGSGSRNTGSETSYSITPGSNLTAGALAILCVSYDNSASSGADPFSSISDTKSNTWTSRRNVLNDPGAANAGNCLRIFTTNQNGGTLTTSDTITVSFGSNTTVARAYTLMEFTSNTGTPIYKTGGSTTGSSTTPSITTSSIISGQAVVGAMGAEGATTITGDTDTTNGSWSTSQSATIGSGLTGCQINSQRKVTTGTGTQTYNLTITSADWGIAWISIAESITSTIGLLTQTITNYSITPVLPKLTTIGLLTQTITKYNLQLNFNIVISAKNLIYNKFAISVIKSNIIIVTNQLQIITLYNSQIYLSTIITITNSLKSLNQYQPNIILNTITTIGKQSFLTSTYISIIFLAKISTISTTNVSTNRFSINSIVDYIYTMLTETLNTTNYNINLNYIIITDVNDFNLDTFNVNINFNNIKTIESNSLILNLLSIYLKYFYYSQTSQFDLTKYNPEVIKTNTNNKESIPETLVTNLQTFPLKLNRNVFINYGSLQLENQPIEVTNTNNIEAPINQKDLFLSTFDLVLYLNKISIINLISNLLGLNQLQILIPKLTIIHNTNVLLNFSSIDIFLNKICILSTKILLTNFNNLVLYSKINISICSILIDLKNIKTTEDQIVYTNKSDLVIVENDIIVDNHLALRLDNYNINLRTYRLVALRNEIGLRAKVGFVLSNNYWLIG